MSRYAWLFFMMWAACGIAPRTGRCDDMHQPLPPSPIRPGAASGPTEISVALWVGDISKIDSMAQTFSANFLLILRWHDERLAHDGPDVKTFNVDQVWSLKWLVANEDGDTVHTLPETVDVAPNGMVIYRQRLVGSFSQSLNLRDFPFDQATFRIHFVIRGIAPDDLRVVPDKTMVAAGLSSGAGVASQLTLPDWRILSYAMRPLPYQVSPNLETAGFAFEFSAKRVSRHFVLKVIVPILLIVMMSWTVFWIEPTDAGSQLSVAVTAMLTLIAFRFAVDSYVPQLPYLTRLDSFILGGTLLVFLSLVEVMITNKLANRAKIDAARSIDRCSRFVFPSLFVVILLWAFQF